MSGLLFRNINPSWVTGEEVGSLAFRPFPNDEGKLSVDCETIVTASQAYDHFTSALGNNSVGVLAMSRPECSAENLPVVPDPIGPPLQNDAHHLIDFTGVQSKNKISIIAKRLKRNAMHRDWAFKPQQNSGA